MVISVNASHAREERIEQQLFTNTSKATPLLKVKSEILELQALRDFLSQLFRTTFADVVSPVYSSRADERKKRTPVVMLSKLISILELVLEASELQALRDSHNQFFRIVVAEVVTSTGVLCVSEERWKNRNLVILQKLLSLPDIKRETSELVAVPRDSDCYFFETLMSNLIIPVCHHSQRRKMKIQKSTHASRTL